MSRRLASAQARLETFAIETTRDFCWNHTGRQRMDSLRFLFDDSSSVDTYLYHDSGSLWHLRHDNVCPEDTETIQERDRRISEALEGAGDQLGFRLALIRI